MYIGIMYFIIYKIIFIITSVFRNRQAQELTERTSSEQAASIREPLAGVNRRWAALVAGVADRQRRLEGALLRLGQFQHALHELMVWIDRSDATLDSLKPVGVKIYYYINLNGNTKMCVTWVTEIPHTCCVYRFCRNTTTIN